MTLRESGARGSAPAGWARQVLLVAWKDLRRVRGLLLLHLALVGAALMAPFLPSASGVLQHFPFAPALVVLGMVAAARCIQADPPDRSRAFWAAHPLAPSAVLSAKAAVIGGAILAVALLGQLVGLLLYRIPVGEALPLLGGSGAIYALWLITGAALAAAFRGLAGAAAAGIAGFVAAYALTGAVWVGLLSVGWVPGTGGAAPWIGPIGALLLGGTAYLLLLRMYLAGEDSLRWKLAGIGMLAAAVVVLGMGTLVAMPTGVRSAPLPARDAPIPDAHLGRLGVEVVQARRQPSGELRLWLEVTGPEDGASNGRLRLGAVHLVRPDGTADELEMLLPLDIRGSRPPVSAAGSWPGGAPGEGWEGVMVRLSANEAQWEALRAGGAALRVEGRLEALEARHRGSFGLRPGGTIAAAGTRFRIDNIEGEGARLQIDITATSVGGPARDFGILARPGGPTRGLGFALLDGSGHEGFVLNPGRGSGHGGSPLGAPGLPLPGAPVWVTELGASPLLPPEPDAVPDREWLRDATIHLFEWEPVGARHLTVTSAVDPAWDLDR